MVTSRWSGLKKSQKSTYIARAGCRSQLVHPSQGTYQKPYTMRMTTVLSLFVLALSSCTTQSTNQEAEAQELMQLSRQWAKDASTNDAEKVLSYWTEDAVIMSAGQPALRGRKAIRQMLEETSKVPGFKINWEPVEAFVSRSGDLGYVIAKTAITIPDSTGNAITSFHNAVEIWKKQEDGSWKNVVDISTQDPALTSIK
jgi:uncharacterized protein (TIGR02246 family)